MTLINSSQLNCKDFSDSDTEKKLSQFTDSFNFFSPTQHNTLKTLYGVNPKNILEPIEIENITIYSIPKHNSLIKSQFDGCEHLFNDSHEKVVIEHRSITRDKDKALELANKAFNTLDLLIAFLLGDRNKTHGAGITRLRFVPSQRARITSIHGYFGSKDDDFTFYGENVDIFELLRPDTSQSSKTLYKLISIVMKPADKIEMKISKAVEWIGEAYIDPNRSSGFLKAAVAMEVLLKTDEKGVISSSIISSISEQCALLLGHDIPSCIEIEGDIKYLYGVRSSIVHSGSSSIDEKSFDKIVNLIRRVIFEMIRLKATLNLKSTAALQETLKARKYSRISACTTEKQLN